MLLVAMKTFCQKSSLEKDIDIANDEADRDIEKADNSLGVVIVPLKTLPQVLKSRNSTQKD